MNKKTLLSGIQPSGRPHIGNYFGAIKQMVELQNSGNFNCMIMIADYHALNTVQDKSKMKEYILNLAIDYLALGIDPKKVILFKQSDVSAHTELTWIFDSIVTMPFLMLGHAFKGKADAVGVEDFMNDINKPISSLNNEPDTYREMVSRVFRGINVGTFNYPVLMAADILLYDTAVVPVGQDQKQHIEYARDIALKFNHTFGAKNTENYDDLIFKLPEPLIMENVAIVPGIDGRKMSKSYGNTIPLFATREEIQKAVMSIVTDSSSVGQGDIPMNVYNIHKLVKEESKLKELYEVNKGKYKALKDALIEDLDAFIAPLRERRAVLAKNEKKVMKILEKGAKQANKAANAKMAVVKRAIGVK